MKLNFIPSQCSWEDFSGPVGFIFKNSLYISVERKQRVPGFSYCNKSSIGLTNGIVFNQPIYENIDETIKCRNNDSSKVAFGRWKLNAKSRIMLLLLNNTLIHKSIHSRLDVWL